MPSNHGQQKCDICKGTLILDQTTHYLRWFRCSNCGVTASRPVTGYTRRKREGKTNDHNKPRRW